MTTAMVTAAAPALTPSEPPVGDTTSPPPPDGRSEAMIITSLLAEHGGPLGSIRHKTDDAVRDIVRRVLDRATHEDVLAWRRRTHPPEWALRWEAAREVAARVYGDHLPGVRAVPDFYRAFDGTASG